MAEYIIQDSTLTAIADAIREKTGGTAVLTPAEMATMITGIETGGGLPDGVSAIASGTFTPTSTITTSYSVEHGLGTTPDFFIVVASDTIPYGNAFMHESFVRFSFSYNNKTYSGVRSYSSANSTAAVNSYSQVLTDNSGCVSGSHFTISHVGMNERLLTFFTYRWIAGTFAI